MKISDVVVTRPPAEIRLGGIYEFEGERVEVTHLGDPECVIQVFGIKTGRVVALKDLQCGVFRSCELIDLANMPAARWAIGVRNRPVIQKAVDDAVTSHEELNRRGKAIGLKWRQMQEYMRRFRAQRSTSSCIPLPSGRQKKSQCLDKTVERIIDEVFQEVTASEIGTSMEEIEEQISSQCTAQDLPPPSRDTIQRRMKAAGVSLSRRRRLGPHKYRESVQPLKSKHEVAHPGAEFQVDHTLIDLISLCDLRRFVLGRLWLTLVLDVFSRAVMGFYLSFRPPSMMSVARALTMAVSDKTKLMAQWGMADLEWPMRGIPLVVHTDHGAEFHSSGYLRGCQEHGIDPRWRLATRWGGHIERMIGTLMAKLHLLPGTTFSNVPQRIKYQPQARAVMTVSDVLRYIVATICEYHETKHRSLGTTPRMRWEEGQSLVPATCLRAPAWPKFLWDFLPQTTSVRQRDGLHWGGYTYNSGVLLRVPVRTKVNYRVDPWDTRNALVEMPNGLYSEVPRVTATQFDHHELERQYRICKGNGASAADIVIRKEKAASKRKTVLRKAKAAAEAAQSDLFSIVSSSIGTPVVKQPEQIVLPPSNRPGVFVRPAVVFNTTRL